MVGTNANTKIRIIQISHLVIIWHMFNDKK
jgi:hypothetical protein